VIIALSIILTARYTPLMQMFLIIPAMLLAMKVIVITESHRTIHLNFSQWLAFTFGWVGMRPVVFNSLPSAPLRSFELLVEAILFSIAGFGLVWLSAENVNIYVSTTLLLIGFSLILHFGILNIITALWRSAGVNVSELFRAPYKSRSLTEFWGRRWNLAFSEMTALIAYRPLKVKIGVSAALFVSFLLSGILHEIAISFPVRAGYGFPLLYFAIHGIGMLLESRTLIMKKIVGHPVLSHIWVMTMLVVPLPLLFHRQFVAGVLEPLRDWILFF
jgi:alginate O-acetyltransferase complex protein AlgI